MTDLIIDFVERVIREGGNASADDQRLFRILLAAAGISTAQNAAALDFVFWGDSFMAGVSGQVPWPTLFRTAFRRGEYQNRGVGGETSAMIKDRFMAMPSLWTNPTLICAGRNDFGDGGVAAAANIATMVASLRSVGNNQFLIIGICNSQIEGIGTDNYNKMLNFHSILSAAYGSQFVDVRPYVVAAFNPQLPQDVADHAIDVTPTSLRAPGDALHLATSGNAVYWPPIYNRWAQLFPVIDAAVTMANLEAILRNPWDRQVPLWITSANPIMCADNQGRRISTAGSISAVQNGDGFRWHGVMYGDGQTWLGGSSSSDWWDRAFLKTLVQVPLLRAANASGTNVVGNDTRIAGGSGTGSAAGGKAILAASIPGASGSGVNVARDGLRIDGNQTAGETPAEVWDITQGKWLRISIGPADSAGAGFRYLRVPD